MPGNLRRFIAFRILFNARWYYPVYALMFLDLGLGLGAFSLLNGLWALAIVLCEVPSGALADRFGRKPLLVAAALLMIMEMAFLAFAPVGGGSWLILVLALNRIASGLAEAAASGADEALAYDSLPEEGRETAWATWLTRLMRWQSLAMMTAMLLGAALYDPGFVNGVASWFGVQAEIPSHITHRLPAWLTLGNALGALVVALRFQEPGPTRAVVGGWREAFREMPRIGSWILRHRPVLLTILAGMMLDSFVRLFLTLNSGYYRLIGLPEASYGLIATGMGLLGLVIPPLAARVREKLSRAQAFGLVTALVLAGLAAIGFVRHPFGVLAALWLGAGMFFIGFLTSAYLNADTPSEQRATVLSFKGLAFNLGYGGVSVWLALLQWQIRGANPALDETRILDRCLPWIVPAAMAGLLVVIATAFWTRARSPIDRG